MARSSRRSTVSEGQLVPEFRRRILSGVHLEHLASLADLLHDVGPPCWASHDTAAGLHAFDGFRLAPPFHVEVTRQRNVRRIGHIVHTTDSIPPIDRETMDGVAVVAPTRALIQVAGTSTKVQLTAALDGALRDRLTTEDFLHRRIAALRTSGRYGIPLLLEVLEGNEITRGGQSWLEREFLRLLSAGGLPRPRPQAVLGRRGDRLIRVDFWFDGTPVVVETLGYRWHRTSAQMQIDAERMNRLVLDGFLPLQYTYSRVVNDPTSALGEVATALAPYLGRFG